MSGPGLTAAFLGVPACTEYLALGGLVVGVAVIFVTIVLLGRYLGFATVASCAVAVWCCYHFLDLRADAAFARAELVCRASLTGNLSMLSSDVPQ